MHWQGMENAPQDGTAVLLCFAPYEACAVGFWGTYHPNSPGKACWRLEWTRAKMPEPQCWMLLPKLL